MVKKSPLKKLLNGLVPDYFLYHSYRMKEKKLDLKLIEKELFKYKLIKKKNGIKC